MDRPMTQPMTQQPGYNPNKFIDWLITDVFKVKNDAALSRRLGFNPPIVSKIRHSRLAVTPMVLVRIHEESGLPTLELKKQLFDQDAADAASGDAAEAVLNA